MRPEELTDLLIPRDEIQLIINFVRNWNEGTPVKPALLLHGPTGSGKTAIVELFARKTRRNLIRSVPGDDRTRSGLYKLADIASTVGNILLIEDVDLITAHATLLDLIANTKTMMFLTSTDQNAVDWKLKRSVLTVDVPNPSRRQLERFGWPAEVLDVALNIRQAELLSLEYALSGQNSRFEARCDIRLPRSFNRRMKLYGADLSILERGLLVEYHALGKTTPWIGSCEDEIWRDIIESK